MWNTTDHLQSNMVYLYDLWELQGQRTNLSSQFKLFCRKESKRPRAILHIFKLDCSLRLHISVVANAHSLV